MKNEHLRSRFLYHITHADTLKAARKEGQFREESLETEGFIHCSFHQQMIQTANRFYTGRQGLVILKIDPSKITPEVKLEPAENGELFPHIYGPINLDAIIAEMRFEAEADGHFSKLPAGVD